MTDESLNAGVNANEIPNSIAKKFNWGAFLFGCLWGVFNGAYITLVEIPIFIVLLIVCCFVHVLFILFPFCLLGLKIWFGIKGNSWSWEKTKNKDEAKFNSTQKTWAIVGLVLFVTGFFSSAYVGLIAAMTIPTLVSNTNKQKVRSMKKKSVSIINQATLMNEAQDKKCNLSSEELATCYADNLSIEKREGNKIYMLDGAIYTFVGDGICKNQDSCYIKVDAGGNGIEDDMIVVPLVVDENGVLTCPKDFSSYDFSL